MNTPIKSDPKELYVEDIMQKNFVSILDHKSIFDAASLMAKLKLGMLPVVKEDGTLVGVITDRDIVVRSIAEKKDINKTKVYECMTENPCKVVPGLSCSDAMFLMSRLNVRRVVVENHHKPVGVLSTSDIAKTFNFCPNTICPKEDCILIDVATGLKKTSHLN